jgi:hypothetical protein
VSASSYYNFIENISYYLFKLFLLLHKLIIFVQDEQFIKVNHINYFYEKLLYNNKVFLFVNIFKNLFLLIFWLFYEKIQNRDFFRY